MITAQDVNTALKNVHDPELQIDIITLELVRNVQITAGDVTVIMTLTTPLCPFGPMIIADVTKEIKKIKGVTAVTVDITFDPPWEPSADLRALMGL